jgi:uncharacterized protein (DUF1800 family)
LQQTQGYTAQLDWQYPYGLTKQMVLHNIVYKSSDQLRQRCAWALSQIFTLSANGLNYDPPISEPYAIYYDIFVRNAFGIFRDILKQVSFNPSMSKSFVRMCF